MSGAATLPPTGNLIAREPEWEVGARAGERIRRLLDDPTGYRTMVMTIAPGPLGEPHAHDEIEQIYVLEGDFFDEEEKYGPGDFLLRMPGTMHRSGSRGGGTMIIVFTPLAAPLA